MRKSSKENIIVVCTIALCFIVTVGLCGVFSGKGILGVFKTDKKSETTAYAVSIGGYSDMTLARTTADLIKRRGGAGYVIDGDYAEIIYAVYPDKKSADGVLTALGETGAYVKEISIAGSRLKWADSGVKGAVTNALGYYETAFDALYDTANGLNGGNISIEDATTKIKVLKLQIDDIKSDFYSNSAEYDSAEITEIKLALITTVALLDNINAAENSALFASSVRYALVQLVMCRQALMSRI